MESLHGKGVPLLDGPWGNPLSQDDALEKSHQNGFQVHGHLLIITWEGQLTYLREAWTYHGPNLSASCDGWERARPEHLPLQNPRVQHKYLCLHHSAIHSPFFFAYVGHEEQSTTPSLWRRIHRFLSAKWVLLCSNDAFSRTKLSKGPEYRSNLCTSKESPSAVATLTWILSVFFPIFYRSLKQKLSFPGKISPVPKNWPFQKKEMNPLPTNGIVRGELVRLFLFLGRISRPKISHPRATIQRGTLRSCQLPPGASRVRMDV